MTFNIELLDALDEDTKAKINEWHAVQTNAVTRAKEAVVEEHRVLKENVANYGGLEGIAALKTKAESVTAAEIAATAAANEKDIAKGDLTSVTAQFQTQMAEKQTQIDEMRDGLANKEKQTAVSAAITAAQGSTEVLLPHMDKRVRTKTENGITVLEVLKVDGTLWVLDTGVPATVTDLVAEFKANDVYGACFAAPQSSGSGSVSNPGVTVPTELTNLTDIMKAVKDGTITEDAGRARATEVAKADSKLAVAV